MIRLLLIGFVSCVVLGEQAEKTSGVMDEDDQSHEQEVLQEPVRSFNQLSPEESIAELGILVDRIDVDKDNFISEDELKTWIQNLQTKVMNKDVEDQWEDIDVDKDGLISWEEYKNVTYGSLLDDPQTREDVDMGQILQEERRFTAADTDGDLKVDKHQFNAFLHPEYFHHMEHVVIQEMIDEFDKNKDGFVDLNEFIDEQFPPENKDNDPDVVEKERKDFLEFKDKNKDGKLDKQELRELIFPANSNIADNEAQHLLKESDTDKDGKLTKTEILDKHEMFVASQVTSYGEAVVPHDEL